MAGNTTCWSSPCLASTHIVVSPVAHTFPSPPRTPCSKLSVLAESSASYRRKSRSSRCDVICRYGHLLFLLCVFVVIWPSCDVSLSCSLSTLAWSSCVRILPWSCWACVATRARWPPSWTAAETRVRILLSRRPLRREYPTWHAFGWPSTTTRSRYLGIRILSEVSQTIHTPDRSFVSPSSGFVFAVCGPPNLPAGAVIYLVWEPCRMERQPDGLEVVSLCGDLSHHAPPLPRLLDRT